MKRTIRKAFTKSLPVMAGYMVLGIGFGILLKDAGYGLFWAFIMSLTIYAGSMQYVAVPFLASGASLITVALTTLMVNARHLFYGLTMIDKYKTAGKKKPYLIFSLTDETYSLFFITKVPPDVEEDKFLFAVAALDQSYWILGSGIGALLGNVIPFDTKGIDFAMTALFVVIMTEQWMEIKNRKSVIIGLVCGLVCLLIFGAENFILPTMICIMIILLAGKRALAKDACETKDTLADASSPDDAGDKIEGEVSGNAS